MELPGTKDQGQKVRPPSETIHRALGALRVDEAKLIGHVDEVARASVEETLNGLSGAEADEICRAQRYEGSVEGVEVEPVTTNASSRRRPAT